MDTPSNDELYGLVTDLASRVQSLQQVDYPVYPQQATQTATGAITPTATGPTFVEFNPPKQVDGSIGLVSWTTKLGSLYSIPSDATHVFLQGIVNLGSGNGSIYVRQDAASGQILLAVFGNAGGGTVLGTNWCPLSAAGSFDYSTSGAGVSDFNLFIVGYLQNGTGGMPGSGGGGGSTTLAGLSDVSITGVTTGQVIEWDSGSSRWVNTTLPIAFQETLSGTGTSFTLAHTPLANTLILTRNGNRLISGAGNDYTISGTTITMLRTVSTGERIYAGYFY